MHKFNLLFFIYGWYWSIFSYILVFYNSSITKIEVIVAL